MCTHVQTSPAVPKRVPGLQKEFGRHCIKLWKERMICIWVFLNKVSRGAHVKGLRPPPHPGPALAVAYMAIGSKTTPLNRSTSEHQLE